MSFVSSVPGPSKAALFLLLFAAGCAGTKAPSSPGSPGDRDGDGVADHRDLCPEMPEDLDGVSDDDGCPE